MFHVLRVPAVLVGVLLSVLMLTGPALAFDYAHDDGVAEWLGGNTASDLFQSHVVLTHFDAEPGFTTLHTISVAWPLHGPIVDGSPATLYVWDDPDGDGDPTDAVVLGSWLVTTSQGTGSASLPGGTFVDYPIDATEVGPSFFVGYRLEGSGPLGLLSRLLDLSNPAAKGWFADNVTVGTSVDPNDLAGAEYFGSVSENFMIRAEGLGESFYNGGFEAGNFSGWDFQDLLGSFPLFRFMVRPVGLSLLFGQVRGNGMYASNMGNLVGLSGASRYALSQRVRIPWDAERIAYDSYCVAASGSLPVGTLEIRDGVTGAVLSVLSTPLEQIRTNTQDVSGLRGRDVLVEWILEFPGSLNGEISIDDFRIERDLTSIGLYADAALTQTELVDPPVGVPLPMYVAAKGIPTIGAGIGVTGWEARLSLPREVLVLSSTLLPPGSVNLAGTIGGGAPNNYIVEASSCFGSADDDLTLVQLQVIIVDAGVGSVEVAASDPSLFGTPAWTDCGGVSRAFDVVEPFSIEFTGQPAIESIADVPDDQGGWVRLAVDSPSGDAAGVITGYTLWREVPAAMASRLAEEATPSTRFEELGAVELDGRVFVDSSSKLARGVTAFPAGTWEILSSWYPTQRAQYQVAAPTLLDGDASRYFVSAHTSNPLVWYASLPRTGTSLDNLPPAVPSGLVAAYSGGSFQLSWNTTDEADFQYWRVYRGSSPSFEPDAGNLVHETATAGWSDTVADPLHAHYKVSAVDRSGNESAAAEPETRTSVPSAHVATVLHAARPNPFNPRTTIRFSLARASTMELAVFDVRGRLIKTLVDGATEAGEHQVVWEGIDDEGSPVSSGVYVCRMTTEGFSHGQTLVLVK